MTTHKYASRAEQRRAEAQQAEKKAGTTHIDKPYTGVQTKDVRCSSCKSDVRGCLVCERDKLVQEIVHALGLPNESADVESGEWLIGVLAANARLIAAAPTRYDALREIADLGTDCAPANEPVDHYRSQLYLAISIATRALN